MTLRERLESSSNLGAALRWFALRSRREQGALVTLACVAVVALVFVMIWAPLVERRAQALADIARHDAVLAYVRAAGPALEPASMSQDPPLSIADSAASSGLVIRRIEPDGGQTRITLADAEFARIIAWLDSLERSNVATLAAIEIERRPAPGTVSASVTLEAR